MVTLHFVFGNNVSMGGRETISTLKKIRHDLPVVLTSGYDEDRVMSEEHPELPDLFLSKPYDLNKLCNTIGHGHTIARKRKESQPEGQVTQ